MGSVIPNGLVWSCLPSPKCCVCAPTVGNTTAERAKARHNAAAPSYNIKKLRLFSMQPDPWDNVSSGSRAEDEPCPRRRQLSSEAVAGCGRRLHRRPPSTGLAIGGGTCSNCGRRRRRAWRVQWATCRHMQCSKEHSYSITLSAVTSSVAGTSSPRAFAVRRLRINSNLLGVWNGISDGLVPLRMGTIYCSTI
jgi:hypothetical protein